MTFHATGYGLLPGKCAYVQELCHVVKVRGIAGSKRDKSRRKVRMASRYAEERAPNVSNSCQTLLWTEKKDGRSPVSAQHEQAAGRHEGAKRAKSPEKEAWIPRKQADVTDDGAFH